MSRANRHFLAGHVWHITHRCHRQQFLLKFARDRRAWLRWLYEARRRYGLRVLNYMVTSNHIHLLVSDAGRGEIAASMQLIAGCTAQQYNRRKTRRGAFWEDRYHATAVQTDQHLARCMVYIDLNMVRTGVVRHPVDWIHSGYHEIQHPPARYRIIDAGLLSQLLGFGDTTEMRYHHHQWVETALVQSPLQREPAWTEALAVGQPAFLETIQREVRVSNPGRGLAVGAVGHSLREAPGAYQAVFEGENVLLRPLQDNILSET